MASQAQGLISQLTRKGYTNATIATALGKQKRYIELIASGQRTGDSYVEGLQNLLIGKGETSVPRRTGKAGTPVKGRIGAIKDKSNRVINLESKSPDGKQMINYLKAIEKNKGRIGVIVTFKNYQAYEMTTPARMDIPIWSNGTSAKWINEQMKKTGLTFSELLTQQIENAYSPTVAKNIISVQVNAVYSQ